MSVPFIDWAFPPIIDTETDDMQPSKNTCVHPVFIVTNLLLLYIHVYCTLVRAHDIIHQYEAKLGCELL